MKGSQLLMYGDNVSNSNEKFNTYTFQPEIKEKDLKIFSCSASKKGARGPPRIPDLKPIQPTQNLKAERTA